MNHIRVHKLVDVRCVPQTSDVAEFVRNYRPTLLGSEPRDCGCLVVDLDGGRGVQGCRVSFRHPDNSSESRDGPCEYRHPNLVVNRDDERPLVV